MTPDFTILGAGGFVGRNLVAHLRAQGRTVHAVDRAGLPDLLTGQNRELGHVINAIGLTADFRSRLSETMETHVELTRRVLAATRFTSFLSLSSTRVYQHAADTDENTPLTVQPADASDLYNLSKLAGEALCLTHPSPTVRVARLSNVYGPDSGTESFLGSVLYDALTQGTVSIGQAPQSAKDYIHVAEAVALLAAIAEQGRHRLYNVAAGRNTTHAAIAGALTAVGGCTVRFRDGAPTAAFPSIRVDRLAAEFGWPRSRLVDDLPGLVDAFSKEMNRAC